MKILVDAYLRTIYIYLPYIGNHSRKKTFTICRLSQCSQENIHEFSESVKFFSN